MMIIIIVLILRATAHAADPSVGPFGSRAGVAYGERGGPGNATQPSPGHTQSGNLPAMHSKQPNTT